MSKRKLEVIYDVNKNKLFENAKAEIEELYNELLKLKSNEDTDKLFSLLNQIDHNKDNYFKILFLLSLYCNYFYKVKQNIYTRHLEVSEECFKRDNFKFLINYNTELHRDILELFITYFNTDAVNLIPLTGKILNDLNKIDIEFLKIK